MAHTVSGKLRKQPYIKTGCGQDGQSTMYAIELSEVIKSYNSDEKFYTNYSALFFAKSQAANDFYQKAFAEGSYVVVSCDKLKTDIQQGNDGRTFVKMQMDNPRLEGALPLSDQQGNQNAGWGKPQQPNNGQPYQQQQQQPAQQQYQQSKSNSQPQYSEPPMNFDEDIPFAPIGLMYSNILIHCI